MKVYRVTNLETEKIGHKLWRLTRPLIFAKETGGFITVPVNFITDGASCPRILWALCAPMTGPQAEAAVLHDYLYSLDCDLPYMQYSDVLRYNRKLADEIFYNAMVDNGTTPARAKLIYAGVRVGGSGSFKACHSIDKVKEK